MEVRLQALEGGLQRPALAIQPGHALGRCLAQRYIRQQIEDPVAVSGRFVQLDAQAPKEIRRALRVPDHDPLLGHTPRLHAAGWTERGDLFVRQPGVLPGDEKRATPRDVAQKGTGTKVAILHPEVTGLHGLADLPPTIFADPSEN